MAMTAPLPIDSYVLDALMRDLVGHDRRPSAYIVYLAIVAQAAEGRTGESHQALAWRTGLSKRSVQAAVGHLVARGLVRVERRGATEPAVLTALKPWVR
jgi:hypothetical protein